MQGKEKPFVSEAGAFKAKAEKFTLLPVPTTQEKKKLLGYKDISITEHCYKWDIYLNAAILRRIELKQLLRKRGEKLPLPILGFAFQVKTNVRDIYKLMIKSTTGRAHNSFIHPQSLLKNITRSPRLDYYGLDKHLRQRP